MFGVQLYHSRWQLFMVLFERFVDCYASMVNSYFTIVFDL